MKNNLLKNIRNNIYQYLIIVAVCLVVFLVFSFVLNEGTYIGKSNIYNSDGKEVVTIVINTDDEKTNETLLNELTNEAITEVHSELNTSVNKESKVTKKINIGNAVIRGLIIGLFVCILISLKDLLPKKRIKSTDEISEIFDGAPIIAKFSGKVNEGKIKHEQQN